MIDWSSALNSDKEKPACIRISIFHCVYSFPYEFPGQVKKSRFRIEEFSEKKIRIVDVKANVSRKKMFQEKKNL